MLEYEFETVQCDYSSGYSLIGGVGLETDGHREIILRRAYIDSVLGNLKGQLDNTYIVDEQGRKRKLKERETEE